MSRFVMSVVIVLTLFGVTGPFVAAQDAPTVYTVTAPQTINARGCPRLSCPVLQTFAPGVQLSVIEVVPGESVLGSGTWLRMNADGVDLYVHSSLAAPVEVPPEVTQEAPEDTPPQPASGRDASEDTTPGDSSAEDSAAGDSASGPGLGWVTHSGAGFALETPPSWIDFTELLANDDYLASVTEFLGEDSEYTVEAITTTCGQGLCDVVLVDLGGKAGLFMMHLDMEGMPNSAPLWKILLEEQFKEQGADVLSSEIVDLPSGEAVRLHLVLTLGVPRTPFEYVVYMVITDNRMYMLLFYLDSCCVEDYSATVDQIAAGFRIEPETAVE